VLPCVLPCMIALTPGPHRFALRCGGGCHVNVNVCATAVMPHRNSLPEARRAATTAWERADVELVDSATIELPATRVRLVLPGGGGSGSGWEAAGGRWVDREQRGGRYDVL
jgi:hypothetical protein